MYLPWYLWALACQLSGFSAIFSPPQYCTVECVVVSQNEFLDLPLAYFNVFLNFGVGLFSSTFGFGRFLWWKMGFQNSYFAIKVKISKCSKLLSANFNI